MWNIFKYFAQRKLKEQQEEEQKRQKEIQKLRISQILQEEEVIFGEKLSKVADEENLKRYKEWVHSNSHCPRCNSDKVNERIQRIKGGIEGYSSHSHNFLSSYSNSSLKGQIDTLPINKCNNCNHEWYKSDRGFAYTTELRKDMLRMIIELLKIGDKSNRMYIYYAEKIEPFKGLSIHFLNTLMTEDDYLHKQYCEHYNYQKLIEFGLVSINSKIKD